MKLKVALFVMGSSLLTACSSVPKQANYSTPLLPAWYNGKEVFYITTDVSDPVVAKAKHANYAPRLRDAIPNYPKPPRQKTVIERVYAFPGGKQRTVFPSSPWPAGAESRNKQYSPVWLMYKVTWNDPSQAYELKSEEAIFKAEEKGVVSIERTDVVLNCPIISTPASAEPYIAQ